MTASRIARLVDLIRLCVAHRMAGFVTGLRTAMIAMIGSSLGPSVDVFHRGSVTTILQRTWAGNEPLPLIISIRPTLDLYLSLPDDEDIKSTRE